MNPVLLFWKTKRKSESEVINFCYIGDNWNGSTDENHKSATKNNVCKQANCYWITLKKQMKNNLMGNCIQAANKQFHIHKSFQVHPKWLFLFMLLWFNDNLISLCVRLDNKLEQRTLRLFFSRSSQRSNRATDLKSMKFFGLYHYQRWELFNIVSEIEIFLNLPCFITSSNWHRTFDGIS